MANYTITIEELIENGVELFDDFPIFNEAYRQILKDRIIEFYYLREIGSETVGAFKHRLNARLRLIMPYYNEMYKSTLFEFDPLLNYQIKEVFTRNIVNTGKSKALFSDTAQGRITLEDSQHISEITDGSTDDEGTEEFNRTMEGNIGVQTYSTLLTDFRKTFINVDKMIIDELNNLFMLVY